jgi:SAM-dependent methyltransferase
MGWYNAAVTDRHVTAIITVGMLLRLAWALLVPVEPVSDPAAYDAFARTLAKDHVYGWKATEPGAFWAVGTSAIVAATYLIVGDSYIGVVALNLLAAFVTMLLVFRLAELWFDRRTALLATACVAVWPNLIVFTTVLSSELYFIAFTLLGLWYWEKRDGRPWLNIVLCGVFWGLACYVRPVILLLPVALILPALTRGLPSVRVAGLKSVAAIALMLAVVSPWTYRNMQLFGEPVLVSTNFGPNLWMGNNPDSDGGYMSPPKWAEELSEIERSHALGEAAKTYILSDIPGFVVRTLRKAVMLHSRENIGITWNQAAIERGLGSTGVVAMKVIASGYWYLMLIAAVGGVVLLARHSVIGALFHPALIGWAYFTAVPAVIVADERYHMPATPFIAILAGSFIAYLLRRAPFEFALPGRRSTSFWGDDAAKASVDPATLVYPYYRDAGPLHKFLAKYRPHICPFQPLVAWVPQDARIFDVGCGRGVWLSTLGYMDRISSGLGCDPNAGALRVAEQASEHLARSKSEGGAPLRFIQARSIDDWPDDAFDLVSMVDVLHHVPPPLQEGFLLAAWQRVRVGGRLLYKDMASAPRLHALANRLHDLLLAQQIIHYFPRDAAIDLLARSGGRVLHKSEWRRGPYAHEFLVVEKCS